jgi:hypothetical protein
MTLDAPPIFIASRRDPDVGSVLVSPARDSDALLLLQDGLNVAREIDSNGRLRHDDLA